MKHFLLFLLFVPTLIIAQTTTNETMMHDNENRSYILHLPPQYDGSTPLPLVFVLHGIGDSANNMQNTGFKELGNLEGFISVYPQGLESTFGAAWNNGSNISLLGFTPDDLGFFSNLVDHLVNNYAADPAKIYACGFSMGGIMSHYLGCNLSEKITAIASQAGPMANSLTSDCNATRAIPAMHIHGDADGTVNYNGDTFFGLSSATATAEAWAGFNNCNETPTVSSLPDSANDGYTVTKAEYAPCDEDAEVILMTVHGADHIWMGPNNDIFTTVEFWEFFKNHTNESATTSNVDLSLLDFSIYPNPVQGSLSINGLEKMMEISITDISGRMVLETQTMDVVDVSNLVKGTYFIQVKDTETGASKTEKFIKI